MAADATRDRILRATHVCISRDGLAHTAVEAVAHESGVARATIYRHFPGGRDELLQAVVTWEVGEFLTQLAADAADATDFADWLARSLMAARRRLDDHRVLQQALELEADQLLRPLVTVMPVVRAMLQAELVGRLAEERLRPGVEPDEAAEVLARLLLSFMGTPGCWRLDDRAEVDRLVRQQLLVALDRP